LHDVTSDNGRGDRGELIAEIEDSADGADAFFRSNQRRNRPPYRRCSRQSADGNADPDEGAGSGLGAGSSEDAEAQSGSSDKDGLTNADGVPPALDQRIHEPSSDNQVGERRE